MRGGFFLKFLRNALYGCRGGGREGICVWEIMGILLLLFEPSVLILLFSSFFFF